MYDHSRGCEQFSCGRGCRFLVHREGRWIGKLNLLCLKKVLGINESFPIV